MSQYIDKDVLVAEIDEKLQDLIVCKKDAVYAEERVILRAKTDMCKEILSLLNTLEVKKINLIIHTIIAECCDWLGMNTNLSHDKIEDCRNLMLKVKEEQFKAQESTEDEHWREVRERAAIAAMQGELANPRIAGCFRDYAEGAIKYADALIEQLKTQKEEQFKIQKGE